MPPPVLMASVDPACVVEEPEDLEKEYTYTQMLVVVSHVEPQPFRLRDFRTSHRFRILANSIQDLALQHFALRNPVLALSDTTQISSDRYLMSLPHY